MQSVAATKKWIIWEIPFHFYIFATCSMQHHAKKNSFSHVFLRKCGKKKRFYEMKMEIGVMTALLKMKMNVICSITRHHLRNAQKCSIMNDDASHSCVDV